MVAAAAIFMLASPAVGQAVCGKHDEMVANLEVQYDERRVAFAITTGGWLLEIFAKKNGRTWTILNTNPMGKTCLYGSGSGWRLDRPKPEGTAL